MRKKKSAELFSREFSVVIPSLNEFVHLPRLLDDIKLQTLCPVEIIVAEGGDMRRMARVLKEHSRFLPHCNLISVKGGTPSYARNIGASHSTTGLIFFIDADVRLPKDFFELEVSEFRKRKLDVATAIQKPEKKRFKYVITYALLNFFTLLSPWFSPVATGTCISVSKESFDLVGGFDERITLAEDSDFVKRLVRKGKKFRLLTSSYVIVSVRRFESEGFWRVLRTIIGSFFYRLFVGEDYENRFNYHFGNFK